MGTKFSELPANDPITGAELLCLSQTIDSTLTSVKATVSEIGEHLAGDTIFAENLVVNNTFITELTSDSTFITEISNSLIEAGFVRTIVESEALTTYTLELADAEHKWKTFSNASTITVTIPPQASVAWPDYTYIELHAGGAGDVVIEAGVGVTLRINEHLTDTLYGQHAVAAIKRLSLNEWILFGNLVPVEA